MILSKADTRSTRSVQSIMKRSLGGRGMGGGGMVRTVGRAVGASVGGFHDVFSAVNPKPVSHISLSSAASSPSSPVSATSTTATWQPSAYLYDGEGWVVFDGEVDERDGNGESLEHYVFGSVPSQDEVEDAVSSLQQIFVPAAYSQGMEERASSTSTKVVQTTNSADLMNSVRPSESESDWVEPAMQFYNPNTFQSEGHSNVFDAFRLLQINPSVQRMVVSLSSDKAVWDAVMKNEVVKELKESLYGVCPVVSNEPESSEESSTRRFLKWILNNTKEKLLEFVDKITKLVDDLFRPPKGQGESKTDIFEETLRSSFILSVMVLLVVVVSRLERA